MSRAPTAFHPQSCSPEHRLPLGAVCSRLIQELFIFSFIAPLLLSTEPDNRTPGLCGTLAAAETRNFCCFSLQKKPNKPQTASLVFGVKLRVPPKLSLT